MVFWATILYMAVDHFWLRLFYFFKNTEETLISKYNLIR
jgi:hypothetical protein